MNLEVISQLCNQQNKYHLQMTRNHLKTQFCFICNENWVGLVANNSWRGENSTKL